MGVEFVVLLDIFHNLKKIKIVVISSADVSDIIIYVNC